MSVEKSQHTKLKKIWLTIIQNTLRTGNLCMLEDDNVPIQLVVKGSEFELFLHFRGALI